MSDMKCDWKDCWTTGEIQDDGEIPVGWVTVIDSPPVDTAYFCCHGHAAFWCIDEGVRQVLAAER